MSKIGSISIVLLLGICVLIFRPVPIVTESEALIVKGVVTQISEGGTNDIVFRLKDNNTRYYINRGLELGLTLENLRTQLIDHEVTLKYPSYWTPLDWNNSIRHISKVEFGNEVLFNELRSS